MQGYYYVLNRLKEYLQNNGFTKTVTIGDIFAVDLSKQTIFPLNHIIVNNASITENVMTLNISILFMDLVDESKQLVADLWEGNDNTQDILNTQLAIINRMLSDLIRGELYDEQVSILEAGNCEPFTDRFENKLAGWTLTIDVQVPNDMSIC